MATTEYLRSFVPHIAVLYTRLSVPTVYVETSIDDLFNIDDEPNSDTDEEKVIRYLKNKYSESELKKMVCDAIMSDEIPIDIRMTTTDTRDTEHVLRMESNPEIITKEEIKKL